MEQIEVRYAQEQGTFCLWCGGIMLAGPFSAGVVLKNCACIGVDSAARHQVERRADGELCVRTMLSTRCRVTQIFRTVERGLALSLRVESDTPMCVAQMHVMLSQAATKVFAQENGRFLSVPFDNDAWAKYHYDAYAQGREAYELGVATHADTALLVGSVHQDIWKNVIIPGAGCFDVVSGFASAQTRDSGLHGCVTGTVVDSDEFFICCADTVHHALLRYSDYVKAVHPPLRWDKGVPFGWNSFSAFPASVSLADFKAASEYFSRERFTQKYCKNQVQINYDFAPLVSWEDKKNSCLYAKNNAQGAGFYLAPFAVFNQEEKLNRTLPFSPVCYRDIALRDANGKLLPPVDDLLSLDPTHPELWHSVEQYIAEHIRLGYCYIKVDFLGHACREGAFYERGIETGRQAYWYAMHRLKRLTADKGLFVSASIAPVLPYGFAHARRMCCDCFGTMADVAYALNSLTWSYWLHDNLYAINDPDHVVLYKSFKHSATSFAQAKARFLVSVIAGTVMMFSDDYANPVVKQRADQLLEPDTVMRLIQSKKAFRPATVPTDDAPAQAFYLLWDDAFYLCLFNLENTVKRHRYMLRDIAPNRRFHSAVCVYTGETQALDGEFEVILQPEQSELYEIR